MKIIDYEIQFDIKFNARLLGSSVEDDEYLEAHEQAGFDLMKLSDDIADAIYAYNTIYAYNSALESAIEDFLITECASDREMTISCNAELDGLYGSVDVRFENVTNDQFVNEAMEKLIDFLEEYDFDVDSPSLYGPITVYITAGTDQSLIQLDNLHEELLDAWDEAGVSQNSLRSSDAETQYLLSVFEEPSVDEERCMTALDKFEIDQHAKEKVRKLYEELFKILGEARKKLPSIMYHLDEDCFMAEASTTFTIYFEDVEIV